MAKKAIALLVSALLEVKETPSGKVAKVQTPDNILLDFILDRNNEVRKVRAKKIGSKGEAFTLYFTQARRVAADALGQQKTQRESWAESYGLLGAEK